MKWCRPLPIGSLLAGLLVIPAFARQDGPPPPPQPAQEDSAQAATRDSLRIAYPFRFASESDFLDWVNRRADSLETAANDAPGVPREIELLLAAANRLLASGTEHAATTRVLGVDQEERPDPAALGAIFERVDALFDRATARIVDHEEKSPPPAGEEAQEDLQQQVWRELRLRRDTLKSFALALRAYLLDSGSENDARDRRRTASELSMLLESDSPQIAAAARLWQALLRSDDEDPSRAFSILGPITAPPPVGSQPYRFFGAIVHTRLLAQRRSPTIALAMLMRVEELVETWFSDQRQRGQALRTSAFVRVAILQDWLEDLAGREGHDEEAAWCQSAILTLQEEWLTGEMPRLLRLSPAIPLLVDPDDLGVDNADPPPHPPDGQ